MRLVAVVNERARRGGASVARMFERELVSRLPGEHRRGSSVVLTRSLDDLDRAAQALASDPPDLVIAAGGDGTAIGLLNAVRRAKQSQEAQRGHVAELRSAHTKSLLNLAFMKLGTGNGWANASGAPDVRRSIEVLLRTVSRRERLPFRRFDLVEIEGLVAHFAGTGWDAELIDDFHAQKTDVSVLPPAVRRGLLGYLNGLVTRAVPRNLKLPRVEVSIENAGEAALGIDARGLPFEIPNTAPGSSNALLYHGPVSVCAVGTSDQWGFGFKAFPFARAMPGRFNLRMFVGSTVSALSRVPLLWTGKHPLDGMLTWLLSACDASFSRQVPFQIGGDLLGHRDKIRYGLAAEKVDVLDFHELVAREASKQPSLLRIGRGVLEQAVAPALGFSRP
jgi:diacylglycerol kinase family enzyme